MATTRNTNSSNNDIRLEAIEKRMDRYDEIMETLRDTVVALKAQSEVSYRWTMALISISSIVVGAFIGHFVH